MRGDIDEDIIDTGTKRIPLRWFHWAAFALSLVTNFLILLPI